MKIEQNLDKNNLKDLPLGVDDTDIPEQDESNADILPVRCFKCSRNKLNIIGFIPTTNNLLCSCSCGELNVLPMKRETIPIPEEHSHKREVTYYG